jgi:ligand-binding sensor domain-containing protein
LLPDKKLLSIFSFFLLTFLCYPQKPDIRFEKITNKEGLSTIDVQDVVQDQTGFIWIATDEGLNRYDGYEIIVYKHDPDDPDSLSRGKIV